MLFKKTTIKLLFSYFLFISLCIGCLKIINIVRADTNTLQARTGHEMVYDTQNNQIIMFGGEVHDGSISDFKTTLIFSSQNKTWREIPDINSPESRSHHSMVYNSLTGKVFLYGGRSVTEIAQFNDTWEFDPSTNTWAELHPAISPSGRSAHAMYFDPVFNEVILFGGSTPYSVSSEMWVYNFTANTWYQIFPNYGPGMSYGHSFVYDEIERVGVLFGGRFGNGELQNEIWLFNRSSSNWIKKYPVSKPQARYFTGMVYNPNDANFIMFGGDNENVPLRAMDDTWIYSTKSNIWLEVKTSSNPPSRCKYAMVFDQYLGKVISFGGLGERFSVMYSDLWIFDPITLSWSQEFTITSTDISLSAWVYLLGLIISIGITNHRKCPQVKHRHGRFK